MHLYVHLHRGPQPLPAGPDIVRRVSLSLPLGSARARIVTLTVLAIGLEYARVLAARVPGMVTASLIAGGLALCLLAAGRSPAELGLGWDRLPARVVGGVALGAILLLPALVRWGGGPHLPWDLAAAAVAVSVGEEVAFRGALYSALDAAAGPPLAIVGSTAAWTAAHALSHPPAFLVAVAAAGLLLGVWRWACRDLVGPVLGHVIADLAL
jgi:membrane protease YdiL (CAAX protease family)